MFIFPSSGTSSLDILGIDLVTSSWLINCLFKYCNSQSSSCHDNHDLKQTRKRRTKRKQNSSLKSLNNLLISKFSIFYELPRSGQSCTTWIGITIGKTWNKCHTSAAYLPYLCSIDAIPLQHWCNTSSALIPYLRSIDAIPLQHLCYNFVALMPYHCSTYAIPMQHICHTYAAHMPYLCSIDAILLQHWCHTTAV